MDFGVSNKENGANLLADPLWPLSLPIILDYSIVWRVLNRIQLIVQLDNPYIHTGQRVCL